MYAPLLSLVITVLTVKRSLNRGEGEFLKIIQKLVAPYLNFGIFLSNIVKIIIKILEIISPIMYNDI